MYATVRRSWRARKRELKRVIMRQERPDPELVSVRLTGRAAGGSGWRKDEVCRKFFSHRGPLGNIPMRDVRA